MCDTLPSNNVERIKFLGKAGIVQLANQQLTKSHSDLDISLFDYKISIQTNAYYDPRPLLSISPIEPPY